jgi:hypothetical protein
MVAITYDKKDTFVPYSIKIETLDDHKALLEILHSIRANKIILVGNDREFFEFLMKNTQ